MNFHEPSEDGIAERTDQSLSRSRASPGAAGGLHSRHPSQRPDRRSL